MYRGSGQLVTLGSKDNEWCEFDIGIAKKKYRLIMVSYLTAFLFIILLLSINMANIFITLLAMSLALFFFFIYYLMSSSVWARAIEYWEYSYSILITKQTDINAIGKNVERFMNENDIQYNQKTGEKPGKFVFISFHRKKDNLQTVIIRRIKKGTQIVIFTREFTDKNDAENLRKLVWND